MKANDIIGILFAIALVVGGGVIMHRINIVSDPCYPRTIQTRIEQIKRHERCMTEASCTYEAREILRYDDRIEANLLCAAKDNE